MELEIPNYFISFFSIFLDLPVVGGRIYLQPNAVSEGREGTCCNSYLRSRAYVAFMFYTEESLDLLHSLRFQLL